MHWPGGSKDRGVLAGQLCTKQIKRLERLVFKQKSEQRCHNLGLKHAILVENGYAFYKLADML